MSREETKECIKVMQGYVDGLEIEVKDNIGDRGWMKAHEPCFNWNESKYRIKKEPEYVPFTSDDAEVLIGKDIKITDNNTGFWCINKIVAVSNDCVFIGNSIIGISYDKLLEKYTFLDGTPCGKLKTIE